MCLLTGCTKGDNANAFTIYFYTQNPTLPPVYIVKNNKLVGKVPVLLHSSISPDSNIVHVTTFESSTEIVAADNKGHILESFTYDLNNDGGFKEGGGGYLLYSTTEKEKYKLMVRIDAQM
jgi:hypothetical protein